MDGGKTWKQVNVGGSVDGQTGANSFRSDYETRVDANGRIYGAYVLFGDFNTLTPSIVQVNHSTDGGRTYVGSAAFQDATGFLNDKEIVATGPDPANPKQQNVYVTWVRIDNSNFNQTIMIVGSTDGGVTWSKATAVSNATEDADQTQFGQPSVGPKGEINVSFMDLKTGAIHFRSSPTFANGAFNFGPDVTVTTVNEMMFNTIIPAQPNRGIANIPRSYTDTSPGAHRGRIDIIYCDVAKGGKDPATNEYLVHSDDGGKTWSVPLKINDGKNANSAFNGDMAIDPKTGNIVAAWRDARNDPANGKIDVFAAFSQDGGTTFSQNTKINDKPSSDVGSADPNNFLEYDGVDNFNGTAYFDWSDNSANLGGFKAIFFDTRPNGGVLPGGGGGGSGLPDDRFDPNDTSERATLLGILVGAQQFDNLTINHHPSNGLPDNDWFRWTAGQTGTFNANITYQSPTGGDLDLRVFTLVPNAQGTGLTLVQIASSRRRGTGLQSIAVPIGAGEPVLVWIYGFKHADATYVLKDSIT
ncbi:MAG: exo-alpha-sialidase [Planctomycetota bacterium]|nr:MAG: exo-alpha-sialidase [Planctomycetota bacterium]